MGTAAPIKIRAGVVLLHQDALLLVRQNQRPFWVLPGGTLELGETLAACAQREMLEETSLRVDIGRLLWVCDFIQPPRHVLDVFFLGRLVSGTLNPTMEENIDAMAWMTWAEVDALAQSGAVQPARAFEALLAYWQAGRLTWQDATDASSQTPSPLMSDIYLRASQ